jgi:hypothetical protein
LKESVIVTTIEQEAYAVAAAAARDAQGYVDMEVYQAEFEKRRLARHERLRQDAIASARAMVGWGAIQSDDDWTAAVERAREDHGSGQLLLEQPGVSAISIRR